MKKILVLALALTTIGSSIGTCAYADNESAKRIAEAKIKKEEAQQIALKQLSGTVTDCDLEKMHRKPYTVYWSITVKGDKAKKNFHISAMDGSVMKVTDKDMDD